MNITICNFKGGVGKSLIAHQLITGFGYNGVEVDPYGDLSERLEGKVTFQKLNKKLDENYENTVFDFGGFDDKNIKRAVKQSDLIIIPFVPTPESVQGTIKTLNVVAEFDTPILFVANMGQKAQDIKDVEFVFQEILGFDVDIFELPLSVALQTAIFENKSVLELADQKGLKRFAYQKAAGHIADLHSRILAYS